MTAPTCPACQQAMTGALLRCTTSAGYTVDYLACPECGLMRMDPFPDEATIASFYSEDYYGRGVTKFPGLLERLRNLAAAWDASRLRRYLRDPEGPVLDIGCGSGTFLRAMKRHGHPVFGSEYGGPALERARHVEGLHLHEGPLEEATYPADHFEAISMCHVLEHLSDPAAALGWCAEWLKPGGVLVLEVPNLESWQARLFRSHWLHLGPPPHLHQFTQRALDRMLPEELEVESCITMALQMGMFGALQSAMNTLLAPRDLFYDILLTRGRVRAPAWKKAASLLLALVLAFPAFLFHLAEALAGRGSVLRKVVRKRSGGKGQ